MSFVVMARSSGGPHFSPGFRWNVYVRPSDEMSPVLVAMSGTISSPATPSTCLNVTRFRISSSEYRPHALPRYSPVGSNAPVNPKSSMAVRYTPPFWVDPPVDPEVPVPDAPGDLPFPPHAAATRATPRNRARTPTLDPPRSPRQTRIRVPPPL